MIGISVYVFELVVIVAAQAAGVSALVSVGLSFWLGMMASFGLQKIVTFNDRRVHHKILILQFLAFGLLVFFNFGVTLLVTKLLIGYVPAVFTRTLALGLTTVWNFYLYKTRIFNVNSNLLF